MPARKILPAQWTPSERAHSDETDDGNDHEDDCPDPDRPVTAHTSFPSGLLGGCLGSGAALCDFRFFDIDSLLNWSSRPFGQVGRARLETVRIADAAIAAQRIQMSWSRNPAKAGILRCLELIYLNYED